MQSLLLIILYHDGCFKYTLIRSWHRHKFDTILHSQWQLHVLSPCFRFNKRLLSLLVSTKYQYQRLKLQADFPYICKFRAKTVNPLFQAIKCLFYM